MFLANLSASVLKLCDSRKLSYEAASEQCNLSARYFGDIARGKTAPTILTLEKLCMGFELTPNDLLIPSEILAGTGFPQADARYKDPLFLSHLWSYRLPGLSPVRENHGTGIPVLLRPLRAVPRLEGFFQSHHPSASEMMSMPHSRPDSF